MTLPAKRSLRLSDVAAAAGVSVSTASRALNGDRRIGEGTRRKVEHAAKTLRYRRHSVARSLATRRSGTIGLLVHDVQDPFTASLIGGLEDVLPAQGYVCLLQHMGEGPDERARVLDLLADRRVDGVVVEVYADADVPALDVPVIAIGRHGVAGVPYVGIDNGEGGRLAASHLLQKGAARPGILFARPDLHPVADRRAGFLGELAAAGSVALEAEVGDLAYPAAGDGARRLLDMGADAIFAVNDLMGVAALAAVRGRGVEVPDRLLLLGYDDAPMADWPDVQLTSIRADVAWLCRTASASLVAMIDDPSAQVASVVARPALVPRRTTSSAPLRGMEAAQEVGSARAGGR